MGTSWDLEGSHGSVVGIWRVPWELCGNFMGLMGTFENFVGTSWEFRGNLEGPMGTCGFFIGLMRTCGNFVRPRRNFVGA